MPEKLTWQSELERVRRSDRSRANAKKGNKTEDIAKRALEDMGLLCVESINRDWIIRWGYDPIKKRQKVIDAIPKKKIAGDMTAIEPSTGRFVLIEVKSKDTKTLPYSVLEDHQVQSLNAKMAAGAICLLVWVRLGEVKIYRWPIENFKPKKSLRW